MELRDLKAVESLKNVVGLELRAARPLVLRMEIRACAITRTDLDPKVQSGQLFSVLDYKVIGDQIYAGIRVID